MPRVERSTDIEASPGLVWRWLTEPEKILAWNEAFTDCTVTGQEEGSVYVMDQEIEGKRQRYHFTVTEWIEPRRLAFTIRPESDDMHVERTYTLRPTEEGCTILFVEYLELQGVIGSIIGRLFAGRRMAKYREQMLAELKAAVEEATP